MLVAVAAVSAFTLAGCSSSTPTVTTATTSTAAATSSAAAQSTAAAPAATVEDAALEPLGGGACVEVTEANLDLAVASSTEEATTAADVLKKYDLTASAKQAVDHFVKTGGAQFDDPDFQKFNDELEKWVKGVCP